MDGSKVTDSRCTGLLHAMTINLRFSLRKVLDFSEAAACLYGRDVTRSIHTINKKTKLKNIGTVKIGHV
jgi:hypothetical protein